MREMIFCVVLKAGEGEKDSLRLAHSIRTFGGEYCFNPIWMFSSMEEDDLSAATRQELYSIGARLVTVELDPSERQLLSSAYVTAAGIAEGLAQGETSFLVMMAADTLVFQEPSMFMLPPGKSFAGCPVHLKLLGSALDEPIDDFWQLIYENCRVDLQRVFPMQTVVDEQVIRAYFNADLLVVRPERGLLRGWQANFERLSRLPVFEAYYRQSELYEIFMHQAVLAGTLLSSLRPEEFQQLPLEVNYPLHLHSRIPEQRRPSSLSQLITARYEEFSETFSDACLRELLDTDLAINNWLQSQP